MRNILKACCWLVLLFSPVSFAISSISAQALLDQARAQAGVNPQRYLQILQQHSVQSMPETFKTQFLSHLAYALVLNDEFSKALQIADSGLQRSSAVVEVDAGVRLREAKVTAEIELAMQQEALQSNEDMLAFSQRHGHHIGEAKALVYRMYFHLQNNRWLDALQSIQRAYSVAYHETAHGDDLEVRATVNHEMGRIYERFDPLRAAAHYKESIRLSRLVDRYRDYLITTHRLVLVQLTLENYDDAEATINRLAQDAEDKSALSPLFSAHTSRSRLALARENVEGARYAFSQATALLPRIQSRQLLRHYFLQQARLLQQDGDHRALLALLKRHKALFPETLRSKTSLSYMTLLAETHAALGASEDAYGVEQARLKLFRLMKDDERVIQQEEMRMSLEKEQLAWTQRLQRRDQIAAPDVDADYRWRALFAASVLFVLLFTVLAFTYFKRRRALRKNVMVYEQSLFHRELQRRLNTPSLLQNGLRLFYVRVARPAGPDAACETCHAQALEQLELKLADNRHDNDLCFRLQEDELVMLLDRENHSEVMASCTRLAERLSREFRELECSPMPKFSSLFVLVESPNLRLSVLQRRVDREFRAHETMAEMISVTL